MPSDKENYDVAKIYDRDEDDSEENKVEILFTIFADQNIMPLVFENKAPESQDEDYLFPKITRSSFVDE